ncbi:glycine zipper 2TM domain-containing protein [Lysobacter enzymogenes]|uniref:glycine zipper 2TM domain-containing protein n=1 Tax=Lysobacter enzymogenes TaxID=69 RepID=UPI00384D13AF
MYKASGASLKGAAAALAIAAGLAAAPNAEALTKQERRALAGAIVGGVAGSLLSHGDPWATAGGALAGGAIGGVSGHDNRRDRWREDARQREWERRERERREWEWRERERRQHNYWRDR